MRIAIDGIMGKRPRKIINHFLWDISRCLHKEIPIERIDEILREQGWKLVQEDGTDFEGIFCGNDGKANIEVMEVASNYHLNGFIVLSWHRFDTGKYEILVYLS